MIWKKLDRWGPRTDFPKDGERVLVRMKNGQFYICIFDDYTDSYSRVADFWLDMNCGDLGKIKIADIDNLPEYWTPIPGLLLQ